MNILDASSFKLLITTQDKKNVTDRNLHFYTEKPKHRTLGKTVENPHEALKMKQRKQVFMFVTKALL